MAATLAKMDQSIRAGKDGEDLEYELKVGGYFIRLAELDIRRQIWELSNNIDESMRQTAVTVRKAVDAMPNEKFSIPEKSPTAKGTGRVLKQDGIKQFGSGSVYKERVRQSV